MNTPKGCEPLKGQKWMVELLMRAVKSFEQCRCFARAALREGSSEWARKWAYYSRGHWKQVLRYRAMVEGGER